jgi:hypothetical protein
MKLQKQVAVPIIICIVGISIMLLFIFFDSPKKPANSIPVPLTQIPLPTQTSPEVMRITNNGNTTIPNHLLIIYQNGSGDITCQEKNGIACTAKHFPPNTFQVPQLQNVLDQIGDASKVPTDSCENTIPNTVQQPIPYVLTLTFHNKTTGNILCISGEAREMYQDFKSMLVDLDTKTFQKIIIQRQ